jgi:hypothetical protein
MQISSKIHHDQEILGGARLAAPRGARNPADTPARRVHAQYLPERQAYERGAYGDAATGAERFPSGHKIIT